MSCPAYVFVFENINRAFSLLYIRTQVPKQENSCDCGVFMLTYVEHFFRAFSDARYMTTQHLVDKLSAFVNENWFTLGDIGRKRREIRGVFDKFRRYDGN